MVFIIPYKRSTLESLEPTWIVLMSELTFASSRTGGMGRIMISMGTRWTSFTAAECTLLSEAIARNDICLKQHTTTTTTNQIWRLESITIAGTLQALLHHVVFSMLSKVWEKKGMNLGMNGILESHRERKFSRTCQLRPLGRVFFFLFGDLMEINFECKKLRTNGDFISATSSENKN